MSHRFFILFVILFSVSSLLAQIPLKINYQGKLTDPDGIALDGLTGIKFSIYDTSAGGSPLWEDSMIVDVSKGLFDVVLGSGDTFPDSMDFTEEYWLELKVESEVLSPRRSLNAVPYSIAANYAVHASFAESTSIGSADADWTGAGTGQMYATNFGDSVAIGRENPQEKVHISGGSLLLDINNGVKIFDTSGNPSDVLKLNGGNDIIIGKWSQLKIAQGSTVNSIFVNNCGQVGIGNPTPLWGTIDVRHTHCGTTHLAMFRDESNNPLVVIDEFGWLGLGTIDPTEKLDVEGNAKVRDTLMIGEVSEDSLTDSILVLSRDSTVSWTSKSVLVATDNDWTGAGTGQMYAPNINDNIGVGIINPSAKLHVIQDSTTGEAGYFFTNNASNPVSALKTYTYGNGNALEAFTNGNGNTIYAENNGTGGRAGYFIINNASNSSNAVHSQTNASGSAIYADNTGTGSAGRFYINNTGNAAPAVYAETKGTYCAGYFRIDNSGSSNHAVYGETNGGGHAIHGEAQGNGDAIYGHVNTLATGRAGYFFINSSTNNSDGILVETGGLGKAGNFHINNAANASDVVSAQTNGTGKAGYFEIDNGSNSNPALYGYVKNGSGPAVYGYNEGSGDGGYFWINNTGNSNPAVAAITNGSGGAVWASISGAGSGSLFRGQHNGSSGNLLQLQTSGGDKFVVDHDGDGNIYGDFQVGDTLIIGDAEVDNTTDSILVLSSDGKVSTTSKSSLGGGGGQIIYDAIVAPVGGDYATVEAALAAGKKTIFVKAGNYGEAQWVLDSTGIRIIGERRGAVTITFSDLSQCIQVKADNIHLENLILRGSGTNATDYLIYCDNGKKNFVVIECDLENIKHMLVYGQYATIRIYGCKLDGTGGSDYGLIQDFYKNSIVEGCLLITEPSAGLQQIWNSISGTVSGCRIEGNRLLLTMGGMGEGVVTGSDFRVRTIIFGSGNYKGNSIYGNEDPGTNAVVTTQGVVRFIGNTITSSYYAKKILKIEGNAAIVTGNFFQWGKDIEIANKYVQFCNNNWWGSAVSQQMTITLTAACIRSQINENTVIGTGFIPLITDSGLNNNKLNNILATF